MTMNEAKENNNNNEEPLILGISIEFIDLTNSPYQDESEVNERVSSITTWEDSYIFNTSEIPSGSEEFSPLPVHLIDSDFDRIKFQRNMEKRLESSKNSVVTEDTIVDSPKKVASRYSLSDGKISPRKLGRKKRDSFSKMFKNKSHVKSPRNEVGPATNLCISINNDECVLLDDSFTILDEDKIVEYPQDEEYPSSLVSVESSKKSLQKTAGKRFVSPPGSTKRLEQPVEIIKDVKQIFPSVLSKNPENPIVNTNMTKDGDHDSEFSNRKKKCIFPVRRTRAKPSPIVDDDELPNKKIISKTRFGSTTASVKQGINITSDGRSKAPGFQNMEQHPSSSHSGRPYSMLSVQPSSLHSGRTNSLLPVGGSEPLHIRGISFRDVQNRSNIEDSEGNHASVMPVYRNISSYHTYENSVPDFNFQRHAIDNVIPEDNLVDLSSAKDYNANSIVFQERSLANADLSGSVEPAIIEEQRNYNYKSVESLVVQDHRVNSFHNSADSSTGEIDMRLNNSPSCLVVHNPESISTGKVFVKSTISDPGLDPMLVLQYLDYVNVSSTYLGCLESAFKSIVTKATSFSMDKTGFQTFLTEDDNIKLLEACLLLLNHTNLQSVSEEEIGHIQISRSGLESLLSLLKKKCNSRQFIDIKKFAQSTSHLKNSETLFLTDQFIKYRNCEITDQAEILDIGKNVLNWQVEMLINRGNTSSKSAVDNILSRREAEGNRNLVAKIENEDPNQDGTKYLSQNSMHLASLFYASQADISHQHTDFQYVDTNYNTIARPRILGTYSSTISSNSRTIISTATTGNIAATSGNIAATSTADDTNDRSNDTLKNQLRLKKEQVEKLVDNFSDLAEDSQIAISNYLTCLEVTEPQYVSTLRKRLPKISL